MKSLRRRCALLLATTSWWSSRVREILPFRAVVTFKHCFTHRLLVRYVRVGALALMMVPSATFAQVVISEIMYDVSGSDSKTEWVEIQNLGAKPVDISSWKFVDTSKHSLNAPPKNGSSGSLIMEPGAYLILASDATTFLLENSVQVSVIDTVMSLNNEKGSVSLVNASSTVEDKATFSVSKGASGDGNSLQIVDGKWKASTPTPGYANAIVAKPKAVAATKAPKAVVKKPTSKPKVQNSQASTETSVEEISDTINASSSVASAVVPLAEDDATGLSWIYGALALGVAGAGAVFVSRQKMKDEWEISEIA